MTLWPEAREYLARTAEAESVGSPGFDITMRREADRTAALAEEREPVALVRDLDAEGVRVRLYRPEEADEGVVVHLHGGGFVLNDIDVHDAACRRLANRVGISVLSVDYRRPPEHRFPAAPDDVDTALGWLDREGASYDLPGPVFAHGDSAGGNLALVAALRNPGRLRAVVLIYPFLDPTASFESYRLGAASGFDPREARWYWDQYAGTPEDLRDPDLAPLLSERLHTLPPTLIATAEHDPLRDEGEHLAHLLARSGVAVTGTRYLGQIHGFWRHHREFPAAETLMEQVAAFVRGHL